MSNTSEPNASEPNTLEQGTLEQGQDRSPASSSSPQSLELPCGMQRRTIDGEIIVDAMAGRTSVFGFGFEPLQEAMQQASRCVIGDSAERLEIGDGTDLASEMEPDAGELASRTDLGPIGVGRLCDQIRDCFAEGVQPDNILLRPSADAAVDTAVGLARRAQSERGFRTIALVGSDHGRTGMCRSASGRPELHERFGPMMAGFSHVVAGDVGELRAAIDDQTACVLLSPVSVSGPAVACEADYLVEVRRICDEHGLLLLIDETQLVVGAAGKALTFASIAGIRADMVVVSAGLFGGLPGGLILTSAMDSPRTITDVDRFPWQAAMLSQTLASMREHGLPEVVHDSNHPLAVEVAKKLSAFPFVRDIQATGLTIGIEIDLAAEQLLGAAEKSGLRIGTTGENGIRLQPPLVIRDEDQSLLLARLGSMMERLERESAELAIQ